MLTLAGWLALVAGLLAGPAFGQAVKDPPAGQPPVKEPETAESPSRLVENPYEFRQPPEIPDVAVPSPLEVQQSIDRGVEFLLGCQRESGAWGAATNTKDLNIYAPIPGAHDGFRMATTSLCISALLANDTAGDPRVQQAVDRAAAWLTEQLPTLKRATSDAIYNCWAHTYSIDALLALRNRPGVTDEQRARLDDLVRSQLEMLDTYESVDGGWGYYDFRYGGRKPTSDSTSFLNGATLVVMQHAKQAGFEVNQRTVQRAVAATIRQQKPDFTYLYGEYMKYSPMSGINRPGGSLGRSQCCNVALRLWGDEKITDNVLKHWLVRLYVRNGWLDMGRKRPIPHESWMGVAGYFYYFGHYYGAICANQLPVGEREPYQGLIAKLLLERQEADGSWWDYPLYDYHQQYGTAYALLTLQQCLPSQE
jgi:hypothetical protein